MVSSTKSLIHENLIQKYNKTSITKQELAHELGVSVSTIDLHMSDKEGIPKYFRLGHSKNSKVLFNIADVAEFLAAGGAK